MPRRIGSQRLQSGAMLVAIVALAIVLSGCSIDGFGPPATIAPEVKTAVAYVPTPTVRRTATRTAVVAPTPTPVAAKTPTPGKNSFVATAAQPCRQVRYTGLIPEKKSTVETVGQVYRCLLLYYVDHATLDDSVLLNGAWSALAPLGKGRFTAEDLAPLTYSGDREADLAMFATHFSALVARAQGVIDASTMARAAIAGMADSLNDNHVAYLEPKFWRQSFNSEVGLEYYPSAGFEVALDELTGKYFLYVVYDNSPAARAGLLAGDIIDNVGGTVVGRGQKNRPLADLMAGLPGTGDTIQVMRPATGKTETVLITVADVTVPLIDIGVLPGNVGYIRLRYFSYGADQTFTRALKVLQGRGITALVFDVRQNPGGSIAALQQILSNFSHDGPFGIMMDGAGVEEPIPADTRVPLLGLPWVVLCDGDSASSADVTAAVAKDRGGYLIGTRSAGALGAALFYEFEDGSAMEITVNRVIGPDREEINEVGVVPHEIVPLTPSDLSAGYDPPLLRAVAYLRGLTGR